MNKNLIICAVLLTCSLVNFIGVNCNGANPCCGVFDQVCCCLDKDGQNKKLKHGIFFHWAFLQCHDFRGCNSLHGMLILFTFLNPFV